MNVLERIVSLYAPHVCVGCGAEGSLLCVLCKPKLPAPVACCYRCKVMTASGRTCLDCRKQAGLVSVNSATQYTGIAKDLVWSLKFDRAQAVADIAGQLLAERYGLGLGPDVLIVPVPTATTRVRKRGYDQAVLIARSLARHSGCTYAPLLLREGSQEQIGASRQQRHDQLQGVFRIKNVQAGASVAGRRVMLVDDVLTTGATLEEASVVIYRAGATAVGALVFARA